MLVCRAEESDCVSSVRVARVPRVRVFVCRAEELFLCCA